MSIQQTGNIIKRIDAKTVKVAVQRRRMHPLYRKQFTKTKHYLVHDTTGNHSVGETVAIAQTKPISKRKHFTIIEMPSL